MWREVSSTTPWPAVWPARLVPGAAADDRHPALGGGPDRGGDVGGVAREGDDSGGLAYMLASPA